MKRKSIMLLRLKKMIFEFGPEDNYHDYGQYYMNDYLKP